MKANRIVILFLVFVGSLLSARESFAFYNPQSGRWLSRDPIDEDGGVNLYSFVDNNPPGHVDPHGDEIDIMAGKFYTSGTETKIDSVQSEANLRKFAEQIRDGFQKIIGDCAKLKIDVVGTDKITVPRFFFGTRVAERTRFRIGYTDEMPNCGCNDCWKVLKEALDSSSVTVQVRYFYDFDNAEAEYSGPLRNAYINPNIDVRLPETGKNGRYVDRPVPFPVALWHEAIGHGYEGLGHPKVSENYVKTWDKVYVDPTIMEENRARKCLRLQNVLSGNRPIGDRRPTYYNDH